jgi:hypothetical protein
MSQRHQDADATFIGQGLGYGNELTHAKSLHFVRYRIITASVPSFGPLLDIFLLNGRFAPAIRRKSSYYHGVFATYPSRSSNSSSLFPVKSVLKVCVP